MISGDWRHYLAVGTLLHQVLSHDISLQLENCGLGKLVKTMFVVVCMCVLVYKF